MTQGNYFGSDATVDKVMKLIERDAQKVADNMAKGKVTTGEEGSKNCDHALAIKAEYIRRVLAAIK